MRLLTNRPVRESALLSGIRIGTCNFAGVEQPVCIPDRFRTKSVHTLGRPGTGKSTLMCGVCLQVINEPSGTITLDPHGDLVEHLLRLIPEEHLDRVVYFNPADPEWVPLWNPLRNMGIKDPGRIADDLVGSIKSVVEGWGDRLESILRCAFLALLPLPDMTLRDVADLMRRNSPESDRLIKRVLETTENESVRKFWSQDFSEYQKSELHPPLHELSKLLASGTYARMLSQPEGQIDFRRIMDEGRILLVDLSGLGSEVRDILGCFMLSSLHLTALSRSAVPDSERRPCYVFVDEAHRFVRGDLEDVLMEIRKYNVSVMLAHQYLSQFATKKRDALASVGSTVIFNVDTKDAAHLRKDLQGKASVDDLISLQTGEAIARIGTEVVRVRTLPVQEIPERNFRERIIAESHRRYYRPLSEIRSHRGGRERSFAPLSTGEEEDVPYGPL